MVKKSSSSVKDWYVTDPDIRELWKNRYTGRFYNARECLYYDPYDNEWSEGRGYPPSGVRCYGNDWYETRISDGNTYLWRDPKTDRFYSQVNCLYWDPVTGLWGPGEGVPPPGAHCGETFMDKWWFG
jgi:hypothetical protein